jgi:predicted nuclease of predicted toxin-antitoxin system
MRILIDECLNWRLGRALLGHYCVSVEKMGWSGVKNGRLLTLAQE